jgi:UDP-3-O-[3-hydroxymyristoyl] glucosamine N-acyltransferase
MKLPAPVSIKWIASLIDAELLGDENAEATGINEIHSVEKGDIVFVDHPKYYNKCLSSAASFIIINKKTEVPEGKALLVVEDPFEAYSKIVKHFNVFVPATKMISDSAVIGSNTVLMPNVFIGNNVHIGDNTIIHPNVSIYDNCIIGNNVVIHSGTVIGSDAFYFNSKKKRDVWYKKMQSIGRVVIEDDVEIGANCTIDRGVSADTKIGRGSKLDNLIHIAHEVELGKNCLIASQVGIAGSTKLGNGVTLWGKVGLSKTLKLGNNVTVLAQSGVGEDIKDNKIYFGTPAGPALAKQKELVWIKRIPEIWEKVKNLPGKEGKIKDTN